ncbi:hypothetical protein [Massilia sp. Root418]|uniref:hypothetical protein n=1 Tax=Massilia sp. Root418 TaxID=1736532 RepID=UPI000B0B1772|nr:hypothetical protein [Massilia sp. Root418]
MRLSIYRPVYRLCGAVLAFCLSSAPSAKAEYLAEANNYRASVKVVPRIGAFWSSAYQEAWQSDCLPQTQSTGLIDWLGYQNKLDRHKAPLAYTLPAQNTGLNAAIGIPEWDILTTRRIGTRLDCGYKARRILITIRAERNNVQQKCEFLFPQRVTIRPIPSDETDSCSLYASLESNREVKFDVDITDTHSLSKQRISTVIPEDVLIVSLGDSFASGEGNPDVPAGVIGKALWMDARCHRSAYAGPLRAAVRILNQQQDIHNERYRRSLSAGAMTVVSFACSGALVSQGLNGDYSGVVPHQKALESYPSWTETKQSATAFGSAVPIEPQISQLKSFLRNQNDDAKTSIDLLLLSGGGNDIQFGALVTAMVARNIALEKTQSAINLSLGEHFNFLSSSYGDLGDALAGLNLQYPAMQTLVVKYPDPLYRMPGKNCSGRIEQGTAEPGGWGLLLGPLSALGQLQLTDDEVAYVRQKVIAPLNSVVEAQAQKYGWLSVDAMKTESNDVSEHGWCLTGAANAYDAQGRWFRSIKDSIRFQGNVNGSFHPTFELTDKIQGVLIAQKFKEAVNAEPVWDVLSIQPSKQQGDTLVVPPSPSIRYAPANTLRPLLSSPSLATWQCEPNADGCTGRSPGFALGGHGANITVDAKAYNAEARRGYERKNLLKLRVDALAPAVGCLVGNATVPVPCSTFSWTKDKEIRIVVSDRDSGVQSALLVTRDDANQQVRTPLIRTSDSEMEIPVSFSRDGEYRLAVCAVDAVGNRTGDAASCEAEFTVGVDTTAPAVAAITAHDVDWSEGARARIPTIPVFGETIPAIAVTFNTKVAPVQCQADVSGCPLPSTVAGTLWGRAVNTISFSDKAGNQTIVQYATIRVSDYSTANRPRTAQQWRARPARTALAAALRAALFVVPSLAEFVDAREPQVATALASLMTAEPNPAEQGAAADLVFSRMKQADLVVGWLNLLSGATYMRDRVPNKAALECMPSTGVPQGQLTQLKWLHNRLRCTEIAGAKKDTRVALAR